MTETKLEERVRIERETAEHLDRFYEMFGQAEAVDYQWESAPPKIKYKRDFEHEYGTD